MRTSRGDCSPLSPGAGTGTTCQLVPMSQKLHCVTSRRPSIRVREPVGDISHPDPICVDLGLPPPAQAPSHIPPKAVIVSSPAPLLAPLPSPPLSQKPRLKIEVYPNNFYQITLSPEPYMCDVEL